MDILSSLLIAQSVAFLLLGYKIYKKGFIDGMTFKDGKLEDKTFVQAVADTVQEVKNKVHESKEIKAEHERIEQEHKDIEAMLNYNGDENNVEK